MKDLCKEHLSVQPRHDGTETFRGDGQASERPDPRVERPVISGVVSNSRVARNYDRCITCAGPCPLPHLKHFGWRWGKANSGRVMPGASADLGRETRHLTSVRAGVLGPRASGCKGATREVQNAGTIELRKI